MRQNRATLMPRKGASRRKTQNQSLGSALVVETMKTRNWGLPQFSRLFRQRGPLTSTKFNQKLKRTKTFCRTFTDCFAKGIGQKTDQVVLKKWGSSCLSRIKLSDHKINLKGMPSKYLWSHLARTNFSKEIEQTGTQRKSLNLNSQPPMQSMKEFQMAVQPVSLLFKFSKGNFDRTRVENWNEQKQN